MMAASVENLSLVDANAPTSVDVHAVVLLSILDHHLRRAEVVKAAGDAGASAAPASAPSTQDRSIGVLLGSNNAGVVEITNSFGVRHVQQDENVLIKKSAVTDLLALHHKINDKEQMVGWYSTTTGGASSSESDSLLDEISLVIHNFFADFCAKPVHLCVDTRLFVDRIGTQAYISTKNNLTDPLLISFETLKTNVIAVPEARVGIDAMLRNTGHGSTGASTQPTPPSLSTATELMPDIEALESSMHRLKGLLDAALAYVDDVVGGHRAPDEAVGRAIADTLNAVPTVDAAGFDRAFTTALRDVLMTSYLTTITSAQMKLAERITSIVPQTAADRERDRGGERGGDREREGGAGRGGGGAYRGGRGAER